MAIRSFQFVSKLTQNEANMRLSDVLHLRIVCTYEDDVWKRTIY